MHDARRLLTWFRKNARPLPWRDTRDPYHIWISEVMLQQTQVATVIPYFHRFLAQYPTLTDLAGADEQAVLHLWSGLGYYRRARDLCRAAAQLHAVGHDTVPNDVDLLRSLPGFGRYTTNAVLSQAYDRRLPILEANSRRVLCRRFGIAEDPAAPAVQKRLWDHAAELLPRKSAGDFNQALMELGALVCTPTAPRCDTCPLATSCQAKLQERQTEIPRRTKTPEPTDVAEVAVVICRGDRLLLVQRPDTGRWANMWEFPHQARGPTETDIQAARRLLRDLGIHGDVGEQIASIRHCVTRYRITMTCLRVQYRRGTLAAGPYAHGTWIRSEDLQDYPLSTPQRRLAHLLTGV